VAVIGRPNVGKSTLINRLVGTKVSITSNRPQTTRSNLRGVVQGEDYQVVLIDTPGIHRPRVEIGRRLNHLAYSGLAGADLGLMVIDVGAGIGPGDRLVAERAGAASIPVVLALNKVDLVGPTRVAPQLAEAAGWNFGAYVPVSAFTGRGLEALIAEVVTRLPEGPRLFPPDQVTDQSEAVLAAEIVREKFISRLRDELTHSLLVRVEEFGDGPDLLRIGLDLVVERPSQKGIVIGKEGRMLGEAGREARQELEERFGRQVHLELRVVVEPDWQRRPQLLDRLGFPGS
jgi:GTP-binding protein Era